MTRLPSLGPRGEGWVALQFALFGLIALAGWQAGDAWTGPLTALTSLIGLGLMLAGIVLGGAGLLGLGRNLTPMPHPRAGADLVETGAYASARHPIYGGIIAFAFGWGLLVASPLALLLAATLAGFFELKSRREEAWLIEHLDGYAEYMTRTRRFFPRLH